MSDQKPSINVYQVYDNELERMHRLLQFYIQLPEGQQQYSVSSYSTAPTSQMGTIYKRIIEMQNILISSFKDRDEVIQNKVAELALTGNADSETK